MLLSCSSELPWPLLTLRTPPDTPLPLPKLLPSLAVIKPAQTVGRATVHGGAGTCAGSPPAKTRAALQGRLATAGPCLWGLCSCCCGCRSHCRLRSCHSLLGLFQISERLILKSTTRALRDLLGTPCPLKTICLSDTPTVSQVYEPLDIDIAMLALQMKSLPGVTNCAC